MRTRHGKLVLLVRCLLTLLADSDSGEPIGKRWMLCVWPLTCPATLCCNLLPVASLLSPQLRPHTSCGPWKGAVWVTTPPIRGCPTQVPDLPHYVLHFGVLHAGHRHMVMFQAERRQASNWQHAVWLVVLLFCAAL